MSSPRIRPLPSAFLLCALAAVSTMTTAKAATAATPAPAHTDTCTDVRPDHFVDVPGHTPALSPRAVEFDLDYRNRGDHARRAAPQVLIESPDHGPYLRPGDVLLEHRTADGSWQPVRLASQTGTLYTSLTGAHRCVPAAGTLHERYRISATPGAQGSLHLRVAVAD
ncbi:signal peptide protein [Streptomyces sp. NPDC059070]|uniref:signal peptide protein n=1 Tax=Streptomyces sp. NPDC059070 TaxID=3346713 RepID=UPI0036A5A62B